MKLKTFSVINSIGLISLLLLTVLSFVFLSALHFRTRDSRCITLIFSNTPRAAESFTITFDLVAFSTHIIVTIKAYLVMLT